MDIQSIRDLIGKIEAGLISKSQNGQYDEYSGDRELLLSIDEIRSCVPRFILDSPNSDIALNNMKAHASGPGSWELRRQFVRNNFTELRKYLDGIESSAALLTESDVDSITLPIIASQLNRAKSLVISDPGSAITKAETVLAGVCRYIINAEGQSMGRSDSLLNLVSMTARTILKLDTKFDTRAFSGISNQAQLVAEIRSGYGDAHPAPSPDDYLAEYAVTTAGALAIFLLKNYGQKIAKDDLGF